jgi:hypothetical protein
MAGSSSEGNGADQIVYFSMRNRDGYATKQTERDESPLLIGKPIIFKSERRPSKHQFDVHKVDAMILEVLLPLRLIPFIAHLQSVYTCDQNSKYGSAAR